ncbi:MAG: endolytic transglycosylase MltG [bacterium]|nr:endolytic transglycosylase MltG [bacterium]
MPRINTKYISSPRQQILLGIVLVLFFVFGFGFGIIFPPHPTSTMPLIIKRGTSAESISNQLKVENIIRSRFLFVWATYLGGIHDELAAGRFLFDESISTFGVLRRLTQPQEELSVFIPEGSTIREIEIILRQNNIPSAEFLDSRRYPNVYKEFHPFLEVIPEGQDLEGFLFPDTYRFYEYSSPEEIVDTMLDNFELKLKPFVSDIDASPHSLYEIITMASILEKEVPSADEKAIVSGIMWKRIREGMPLQVDATLFYELGKTSRELTQSDLKNETPYNTYTYQGLPPGPISNPGAESIEATLNPKETPFYFYLSDRDGNTYFSRNFEEHKEKKFKYLR